MDVPRSFRLRLVENSVSKFVVESLAGDGSPINERDKKEDVVEIGLRDWRPDDASHLTENPFLRKSLPKSRQYPFIIQGFAKTQFALLGR